MQIIAPHDVGIQEAILENLDPMTGVDDTASGIASPLCIDCTDIVKESYFVSIQSLVESDPISLAAGHLLIFHPTEFLATFHQ